MGKMYMFNRACEAKYTAHGAFAAANFNPDFITPLPTRGGVHGCAYRQAHVS